MLARRVGSLAFLLIGLYVGCGSDADDVQGKGGGKGGAGASGGRDGSAGAAKGGFSGTGSGGSSAGAGATGGASGGGSAMGGSGGGSPGSGGTGGSSAPDGSIPDVTFTYDAPPNPNSDACAATSVTAESLPLDIYVILDHSTSMHLPQMDASGVCCGDCNVGQNVDSKWCHAVNALYGFFSAPSSNGMGVALQFFAGADCTALTTPNVALQTLPAGLAQLQNALNAETPNGQTPTLGAANGIVGYTLNNRRPGRKMIGVIVTDGDPVGCDRNTNTPANIGTILTNHFNATGIATYMIGMDGATYDRLETMANGAGAPPHTSYCGFGPSPCHYYDVGSGNPQAFIDALKTIQQTALACEYAMPRPNRGVVDISKVQVNYLAGGQPPPQSIPRVSGAAQCGASGGWYFDNNTTPTRILLCPETCRAVSGDARARIDVFLGCLGA